MDEQMLIDLRDSVYEICKALVAITDFECCMYGFDDAVKMAQKYVDDYDADNSK